LYYMPFGHLSIHTHSAVIVFPSHRNMVSQLPLVPGHFLRAGWPPFVVRCRAPPPVWPPLQLSSARHRICPLRIWPPCRPSRHSLPLRLPARPPAPAASHLAFHVAAAAFRCCRGPVWAWLHVFICCWLAAPRLHLHVVVCSCTASPSLQICCRRRAADAVHSAA